MMAQLLAALQAIIYRGGVRLERFYFSSFNKYTRAKLIVWFSTHAELPFYRVVSNILRVHSIDQSPIQTDWYTTNHSSRYAMA